MVFENIRWLDLSGCAELTDKCVAILAKEKIAEESPEASPEKTKEESKTFQSFQLFIFII